MTSFAAAIAFDGTPPPTATPEPTPTPVPKPPRPATLEGLRIWADGDSTSYWVSSALYAVTLEQGGAVVRGLDYKISSGLTNRGKSAILEVPFDGWMSALPAEMAAYTPDVVFFMVGANDATYAAGNPGRYAELVGQAMDSLQADGRYVIWIGQPGITRPDLADVIPVVNAIFRDQAATRPWVTFVDASAVVPSLGDGLHLSPSDGRAIAELALAGVSNGPQP